MPNNMLSLDTGFPEIRGKSQGQINQEILDHLYMLQEQLRYQLGNLGQENFNETGFNDMVTYIQNPLMVKIEDEAGRITQLGVTAEGLLGRMTSAEGRIGELGVTAEGLVSRMTSAEGSITTLTQVAEGFSLEAKRLSEGLSQTVRISPDGVTITNAEGSRLTIDGGQINAETLVLTGCIKWADLASETQSTIYAQHTSLPNYIKSTYIDHAEIQSPTIKANVFEVHPSEANLYTGSFDIYGYSTLSSSGNEYHMLSIAYDGYGDHTPYTKFYSPKGGNLVFGDNVYGNTIFLGDVHFGQTNIPTGTATVDFSNATTTGLYLRFAP